MLFVNERKDILLYSNWMKYTILRMRSHTKENIFIAHIYKSDMDNKINWPKFYLYKKNE